MIKESTYIFLEEIFLVEKIEYLSNKSFQLVKQIFKESHNLFYCEIFMKTTNTSANIFKGSNEPSQFLPFDTSTKKPFYICTPCFKVKYIERGCPKMRTCEDANFYRNDSFRSKNISTFFSPLFEYFRTLFASFFQGFVF